MSALSDDTIGEIYRFSPLLQQSEDLRPSTTVLKNPMLSPGIKSGLHSTMEFLSTEKTGPHSARVTQTFALTLPESIMALSCEVSTVVSRESDPISPSAVQIQNTIASTSTLLSLEPTLALCGTSLGKERLNGVGCTPPLNYTLLLQSTISIFPSISSTLMLEKPAGTALDVSSVTFSSVDLLKESALTQRDKEVCLAVTRFSLGPLPHEPAARGPCWPLAAA